MNPWTLDLLIGVEKKKKKKTGFQVKTWLCHFPAMQPWKRSMEKSCFRLYKAGVIPASKVLGKSYIWKWAMNYKMLNNPSYSNPFCCFLCLLCFLTHNNNYYLTFIIQQIPTVYLLLSWLTQHKAQNWTLVLPLISGVTLHKRLNLCKPWFLSYRTKAKD